MKSGKYKELRLKNFVVSLLISPYSISLYFHPILKRLFDKEKSIGLVQEPAGSLTSLAELAANGGKFRYFYGEVARKPEFPGNSIISLRLAGLVCCFYIISRARRML
jgi:hypothetical protein